MAQPSPLERRAAKAGESGRSPEPEASGQAPMDKFRTLARRLLSVHREEVAEMEAKHREKAAEPKS